MKITVTQEDIECGVRSDARRCPIARSIKRHIPLAFAVRVCNHIQFFNPPDEGPCARQAVVVATPPVAGKFIGAYDHGDDVGPFSFWLDVGDGAEPFEAPVVAEEAVLA